MWKPRRRRQCGKGARPALLTLVGAGALCLGCAPRTDLLGVASPSPADGAAVDQGAGDDLGGDARFHGGPRFGPPVLVAALSDPSADDEDPSFTGDLRELYFSSTRSGGTSDIWVSRRASAGDPWGAPVLVPELSSSSVDRSPSVALDGLAIWLSTDRDLFRGRIWQSRRANRQLAWGAPVPVSELASPNFDSAPSVDAAETTMFFASVRTGGTTGTDIFSSTRATLGVPWGTPERVSGLDTSVEESDPFVAQGGLVVYLTITRSPGQSDLFWSARRATDAPFPAPLPLDEVNSPAIDSDPALSVDLLYLMFASSRSGNVEIYEAHALE